MAARKRKVSASGGGSTDEDDRFELMLPVDPNQKSQLIAEQLHVPYFARGGNGESIQEGDPTLYFDLDKEKTHVLCNQNWFELGLELTKCSKPAATATEEDWKPLAATDAEKMMLVQYWPGYLFSNIYCLINYNQQRDMTRYVTRGASFAQNFVFTHIRPDFKAAYIRDEDDPVFHTSLSKKSNWALKTGTEGTAWSKYLDDHIKAKLAFTVYFRPTGCWPFDLGRASDWPQAILPSLDNTRFTIALDLDGDLQNCIVKSAANTDRYRFKIKTAQLHMQYARLTQLGARLIKGLPSKKLGAYPSSGFWFQRIFYLKEGVKGDVWTFENQKKPDYVLICAMDSDYFSASEKAASDKDRTLPVKHQISQVTIKYDGHELWSNKPNPGSITDAEQTYYRKAQFISNNHFRMPVHKEFIEKRKIDSYRFPHIYISLSNGNKMQNQLVETVKADGFDAPKGKLELHVLADGDPGLANCYLVSLLYKDVGIQLDAAAKTLTSTVLASG